MLQMLSVIARKDYASMHKNNLAFVAAQLDVLMSSDTVYATR
jgi:hypothetical protein